MDENCKRILFYNWAEITDPRNLGGGVGVYQKNLIRYMEKLEGFELFFLSSGQNYHLGRMKLRIAEVPGNCKCRIFDIVNSPVFSPAHASFRQVNIYNNDTSLLNILINFINIYGPFDVMHLNNLEGLSAHCLEIKSHFPDMKLIFSLHNYFPFCPQVNLWKSEQENCIDNHGGTDCVTCIKAHPPIAIRTYKIASTFLHSRNFFKRNFFYRNTLRLAYLLGLGINLITKPKSLLIKPKPSDYLTFIEQNINAINQYVDMVLAVSERVKEIAISKGVNSNKVIVNYIGTQVALKSVNKLHALNTTKLSIAYLGYMRKDKGFYFLLECLERMPVNLARRISVTIAAQSTDRIALQRINTVKSKFATMYYHDGYTHDELPDILKNTNLGIVPVLWEDNFPQVAKEMYAHGLQIFSSNRGGAKELCASDDFVFEAGNHEDFINKINYLVDHMPECFTQNSTFKLTSFATHVNKLQSIYFS